MRVYAFGWKYNSAMLLNQAVLDFNVHPGKSTYPKLLCVLFLKFFLPHLNIVKNIDCPVKNMTKTFALN